jgi:hypothetical protein
MPIRLDGQIIQTDAPLLADALEAVRLHLEPRHRIISEVWVNGTLLYGQQLIELRGAELADIDLQIVSQDPVVMTIETLNAIRRQLHKAYEEQQAAIILLHQESTREGLAKAMETVAFWDHVLGGVALCLDMLRIEPSQVVYLSRDLPHWADDLRQSIGDLQDAIQQNQTRKVQSLLAEHWPDLTETWGRIIDQLTGSIQSIRRENEP